MKRILLVTVIVALVAVSGFGVALAKPVSPPRDIERAVFIHYKAPAKPDWAGPKEPKVDEGYKLFRGGVKWSNGDLPVAYLVNTGSIPSGVDPSIAFGEICAAFEEWDTNTSKELYNGTVGVTETAGAHKDGDNTIAWVYIGSSNIIAVTTFWYYVNTKELIEFDIELNTQFEWGVNGVGVTEANTALGNPSFMDIRNITTHESGHTLVLNDLYEGQYTQMTMYGYSDYGEVKKISLELGDVAGLQKLYGR